MSKVKKTDPSRVIFENSAVLEYFKNLTDDVVCDNLSKVKNEPVIMITKEEINRAAVEEGVWEDV